MIREHFFDGCAILAAQTVNHIQPFFYGIALLGRKIDICRQHSDRCRQILDLIARFFGFLRQIIQVLR